MVKVAAGAVVTTGVASYSWIATANDYTDLAIRVVGFLAICLTAWYTYERAMKTRTDRTKQENK